MAYSHRNGDSRLCGASTSASQDFVTVDGSLWAVQGDPNSHGGGGLVSSQSFVKINGVPVSLAGDSASPDSLCPTLAGPHCGPSAVGFSNLINVG